MSRRTRLLPENCGLPHLRRRRRTPGLRREEVSALAGISTAYYTWIEQGRTFDVSIEVLDAIARALQLSEIEVAHVFTLAGKVMPRPPLAINGVASWQDAVLDLCRYSDDAPALILTPWCEVSAANHAAQESLAVYAGMNFVEALFRGGTTVRYRRAHALAHAVVAILRRNRARDIENRKFSEIVASLNDRSPDFKALWESHHVENDTRFDLDVERGGASTVRFRGVIVSDPIAARQFALLMTRAHREAERS